MSGLIEIEASACTALTTLELLVAVRAETASAPPDDRLWAALPADLPIFLAQPNAPDAACVDRLSFPRGRSYRPRRFRRDAGAGSGLTFHAVFYSLAHNGREVSSGKNRALRALALYGGRNWGNHKLTVNAAVV